ncbi:hypothetical protein MN116_004590 [Schistosoma mekongi]|uniref:Uncharacterized protein n=1 Tax=Schistosoma mekongi TaxID=38744 RepID=A0AAE1ZCY1_SCHME|nr:hypothetical protein MN116_004590 [Schistosoma mekongi]
MQKNREIKNLLDCAINKLVNHINIIKNMNQLISLSKINEAEMNYTTAVDYSNILNDSMKLTEAYELLAKFYLMNTDKYELAKLSAENGLKYAQTNENLIYNQLKLWYSMSKAKLMEAHYLNTVVAAQYNSDDMVDLIKWKDTRHHLPLFDKDHFMEVTYNSFTKTTNHINQSSSI